MAEIVEPEAMSIGGHELLAALTEQEREELARLLEAIAEEQGLASACIPDTRLCVRRAEKETEEVDCKVCAQGAIAETVIS